jgi:hypothetical protein
MILAMTISDLKRGIRVIKLLQKFSEPRGILQNDIDKKYSGKRQKKNGQV